MKFKAQLKEVKGTGKPSLDMEYRVVLITDESHVLDLGKFPYDTKFKIDVDLDND